LALFLEKKEMGEQWFMRPKVIHRKESQSKKEKKK